MASVFFSCLILDNERRSSNFTLSEQKDDVKLGAQDKLHHRANSTAGFAAEVETDGKQRQKVPHLTTNRTSLYVRGGLLDYQPSKPWINDQSFHLQPTFIASSIAEPHFINWLFEAGRDIIGDEKLVDWGKKGSGIKTRVNFFTKGSFNQPRIHEAWWKTHLTAGGENGIVSWLKLIKTCHSIK